MKKLLLSITLISTLNGWSQPVIVDGSNLQPVGSSNPGFLVTISDIGTAGANQTWDFSLSNTSMTPDLAVIDAATSSFGINFPSSNWAFQLGPYLSYFEASTTELNCHAFNITSMNSAGDYSNNPRKIIEFPFSYGDFFSDTYDDNATSETVTVTYEGYGTLMMPASFTYTNVMRIKEVELTSGVVTTRFYINNPLTIVATHISNTNVFFWNQVSQTNSLNDYQQQTFNVYPNPATTELTISGKIPSESSTLTIVGIDGRIKMKLENTVENQSIDISSLEAGMYFLSNGTQTYSFNKVD